MSSDLYAPPRHVDLAHAAWRTLVAIVAALGGRSMHDPANELRRIRILSTTVNTASRDALGLTVWHDRVQLGKRLGGCRCMWKQSWRNSGSRCPKLPSSPRECSYLSPGYGCTGTAPTLQDRVP